MTGAFKTWALTALLCGGLALASSANAQDATRARLITAVDAQTFADHFPVLALVQGLSGRVVLSCDVAVDGSSACAVAEETPPATGFGAAALAVSRDWQFSPRAENGQPVASTVRIPLEFQNQTNAQQVIQPTIFVDGTRQAASPPLTNAEITAAELAQAFGGLAPVSELDVRPATQADRFARYYPAAAHAANEDGRVLVACAVRSRGNLDCAVERESPVGLGFGQRAVDLVLAIAASGRPPAAGAAFRVPVDFALHDDGSPMVRTHFGPRATNRYYPADAVRRSLNGRALLECRIRENGRLNCTAVSETPTNLGFGYAALQTAEEIRVSQASLGLPGLAVGDVIQMPLNFAIENGR